MGGDGSGRTVSIEKQMGLGKVPSMISNFASVPGDVLELPNYSGLKKGTVNQQSLSGSSLSGGVVFSDGTSFNTDPANFFYDDTNNRLGIGTTTPLHTLDINSVTLLSLRRPSNNAFTCSITGLGGGSTGGDLVFNTSQTDGGFGWRTNTGSANALVIAETSFVGLNVVNPLQILHLSGSSTKTNILVDQGSTGDASINFRLVGIDEWSMGIDNSDGDKFKIADTSNLGTSDRFTIDQNGLVGIATTTPVYPLSVSGSIDVSGSAPLYRISGSAGATGTFTTTDLKTVTVYGGIITSIV